MSRAPSLHRLPPPALSMHSLLFLLLLTVGHPADTGGPGQISMRNAGCPSASLCVPRQEDEEFLAARKLLQEGRLPEAQKAFGRVIRRDPENAWAHFLLGYTVHARAGYASTAAEREDLYRSALELHLEAAGFSVVRANSFYNAACACALLGRSDDAFRYLDLAIENGFESRGLLTKDPDLRSLRDDPRFQTYLPRAVAEPFLGEVRVLFSFEGEAAGDQFGWSGRNAGDCDNDGTTDVVVSAPFKSTHGANAGKVYVFSGRTGELLFSRVGRPGSKLGIGVASAGDVNGDGSADLLCGAPGSGTASGRAFLLSGADGAVLRRFSAGEEADRFGSRVAGVGDTDGDGIGDLLIGAPESCAEGGDSNRATTQATGRAYLFGGAQGKLLLTLEGERPGDEFGSSVAGTASPDGPLLAIGAANAGRGSRGRAYVYLVDGKTPKPRFIVDADRTGAHLGHMFLSFLGDVDGDGTSDLYVSDWENNARGYTTGRVYIRSGVDGRELLTLTGPHAGSGFGSGPGVAGDIDGDGLADLVVGAWRSSRGASMAGTCALFSGRGVPLGEFVCAVDNEAFGFEAVGMGDLDGDGAIDFLVTAAWSAVNGKRSGRAWILAGPTPPEAFESESPVQTARGDDGQR